MAGRDFDGQDRAYRSAGQSEVGPPHRATTSRPAFGSAGTDGRGGTPNQTTRCVNLTNINFRIPTDSPPRRGERGLDCRQGVSLATSYPGEQPRPGRMARAGREGRHRTKPVPRTALCLPRSSIATPTQVHTSSGVRGFAKQRSTTSIRSLPPYRAKKSR